MTTEINYRRMFRFYTKKSNLPKNTIPIGISSNPNIGSQKIDTWRFQTRVRNWGNRLFIKRTLKKVSEKSV